MKIYIAAGHGGNDSGAVGNGTTERDEVQRIVDVTCPLLAKLLAGKAEIVQVPNNLNVNNTPEWINTQNKQEAGNYCIEVHLNSNNGTPGTGIETYYGDKNMATTVHRKLVEKLELFDRGVKDGNNLKFNRETIPASCLVELGFINNRSDLEKVKFLGIDALMNAVYYLVTNQNAPSPAPSDAEKALLQEIKQKLEQEIKNLEELRNRIN